MLASFTTIEGKKVKIGIGFIISVEEETEGVLVNVNFPNSVRVYHVQGTVDSFNDMLVQAIYGA